MFLNIILESFQNLYDALEKRINYLLKFSNVIDSNSKMSDDLKAFANILIQVSLFSNEGITKKQLGLELDISESTVNKRLAKLREMGLLLEEKCKPAKYMLDLNELS
jgi:Fic family protein